MADAALHSMRSVGQRLIRSPRKAAAAVQEALPGAADAHQGDEVGAAVDEEAEEPDHAAPSPASTTGSSHDFSAAASMPLPGK